MAVKGCNVSTFSFSAHAPSRHSLDSFRRFFFSLEYSLSSYFLFFECFEFRTLSTFSLARKRSLGSRSSFRFFFFSRILSLSYFSFFSKCFEFCGENASQPKSLHKIVTDGAYDHQRCRGTHVFFVTFSFARAHLRSFVHRSRSKRKRSPVLIDEIYKQ